MSGFLDWMYLESSYPRKRNDTARAITSEYIPVHINCLQFTYCLKGEDIGRLNVYLKSTDQNKLLVWSLAGDQQSCFQNVYLPVKVLMKSKVIMYIE